MNILKCSHQILIRYVLLVFFISGCSNKPDIKWKPIFNGENLDGWIVKFAGEDTNDSYLNTFRIDEGILKVDYSEYKKFDDKFAHLFFNQELSHYRLRLEYRFVGDSVSGAYPWVYLNSGIMLHAQHPNTMSKKQQFPISLEMQFLGSDNAIKQTTGNVCTPGTHIMIDGKLEKNHIVQSTSNFYERDDWVRAEVEVLGDSIIHHKINGKIVMTYHHPSIGDMDWIKERIPEKMEYWKPLQGTPLKKGYIALQAEGHPIHFKNIELMDLSAIYKN